MNLLNTRKRLWQILERGNENDKVSVYTDIFLITLIILNITAVLLETVDSIYSVYKFEFLLFERISTIYSGWNDQYQIDRSIISTHPYINILLVPS